MLMQIIGILGAAGLAAIYGADLGVTPVFVVVGVSSTVAVSVYVAYSGIRILRRVNAGP